LQETGHIYTRISNPTTSIFENRIASLEGGIGGLEVSSGHAAQITAILTICEAGDHIVSSSTLYGGTVTQLKYSLPKLGIQTTLVDPSDPDNFRRAIQPNTKIIYGETLSNPLVNIFPFEEVSAIAREYGIPLMIDNTFATPYLCRPFEWGADITTHSTTKFIGGHGTSIGGVIVDKRLETLSLRMEQHCKNAQHVAEFLESQTIPITKKKGSICTKVPGRC
jgi:O-acetylhomoserine (thiol)-lyase